MTVMKPMSMQEAAQAIRGRIASLVKREAEQIKDPERRRLFKASMLGSAHMEPGVHEPERAGVPEHMEPGNHEQMAPSDPQPPADESQPVAGGLGVPGGDLQDDGEIGGAENGTVDRCPLCQQPDEPGSCTCLETMAQGGLTKMGADMAGPAGPGVMGGPLMRSELCKTCGSSHKSWEGHSKAVKKTVANPAARAGPRSPQLSKAFDDPGTVPDPKSKTLPKDKTGKEIKNTGNGGEKKNKPTKAPALSKQDQAAEAKYWQSVKKVDVPAAKPPSGKVPGGTGAPPMASNNSAPKIGAPPAPAMAKPPPVPGAPKPLGKAAPTPDVKTQMKTHMMNDASRAAQKPPAAPPAGSIKPAVGVAGVATPPMPGLIPSGGKAPTPNVAAGKGAGIPGFSPGASGAAPGGSFQPQPIKVPPKPARISAPSPAVAAPKRSLFTALFGPKR